MKLHIVDILIICAYLMVIVAIGLFLKKKAAKTGVTHLAITDHAPKMPGSVGILYLPHMQPSHLLCYKHVQSQVYAYVYLLCTS